MPHTHWDREWQLSAATLRVGLVELMDGLLDLLESDPRFGHFLLDGQTAMVDDYLEVRPEAAPRVRTLAAAGRIAIGPWTVLLDELLVSGETIVRNLELGMRRAAELGGVMEVGYLPDMFGHVAQMPQILKLAGFEHAVVWRGVPASIERTAFWWSALDGSRVRAEYLFGSYANGRRLPDTTPALVGRAEAFVAELDGLRRPGEPVLLMNGSDHLAPQPGLGAWAQTANLEQHELRFDITSLPLYLATAPTAQLPEWRGELRSGARANVLVGVASNRVDVRRAAAAAERALEQLAEPLSALALPSDRYPDRLLNRAWRGLVLNSAHDSVGACSADEVVDAVLVRYTEARQLAEAVTGAALAAVAADIAQAGEHIIVNPSQHARSRPRRALTPRPRRPGVRGAHTSRRARPADAGRRDRRRHQGALGPRSSPRGHVRRHARRGPRVARRRRLRAVRRVPHRSAPRPLRPRRLRPGHARSPPRPRCPPRPRHLGSSGSPPRAQPAAHTRGAPRARRSGLRLAPGPRRPRCRRTRTTSRVDAEGTMLDNGVVRLTIDPASGTFAITADGVTARGLNRYVESGDGGDTYNFSPPAQDVVVDVPERVDVELVERGPLRARAVVTATYRWPAHVVGDAQCAVERSAECIATTMRTEIELRVGERFVRVHVELDHHVRDHRIRAVFPLPARVTESDAESAFGVVTRGLTAEGGPLEAGLATFVSRRFVDCSAPGVDGEVVGLALLHDGLPEYEVIEEGAQLALTLLRATGYLSRGAPRLRPNPAGPLMPLAGAQVQGHRSFDYAVLVHRGDWRDADLYDAADDFLVPLAVATTSPLHPSRSPAPSPALAPARSTGQFLTVDGARVSAVHRRAPGGPLVLRVFNPLPNATVARVSTTRGPAPGAIVDLRGRARGTFAGELALRARRRSRRSSSTADHRRAASARVQQRLAARVGCRPRRIERRDRELGALGCVPQHGRTVTMPPQRERDPTTPRGEVVHLEVPSTPRRRPTGEQHETLPVLIQ